MNDKLEQATAVRALWRGADDAFDVVGELGPEVDRHASRARAFLKAWAAEANPDPRELLVGFGRLAALYDRLTDAMERQREALDSLNVRLAPPDGDPVLEQRARVVTLAHLRRDGALADE